MCREPAISVDNVWKKFRKSRLSANHTTIKTLLFKRLRNRTNRREYHQALQEITFTIPSGESWGIIGPNGSGKSTILKLITGIYKPDCGNIRVSGTLASLIELGAGFHPEFSGRENVLLNGIVLGMSRKEINRKFDSIVSFSELEEFIDEPVRTYSTGMYMRLAFSIAVHVDPDILLVDEILSVGDEAFVMRCRDKIKEFRDRKKTMLMVSHDLGAIERSCSRVILLDGGRIAAFGDPASVIDEYRSSVERKISRD